MLDFINYPVSAIMWFWHKVLSYVIPETSGVNWALSVMLPSAAPAPCAIARTS